jgi:hypothetical protein
MILRKVGRPKEKSTNGFYFTSCIAVTYFYRSAYVVRLDERFDFLIVHESLLYISTRENYVFPATFLSLTRIPTMNSSVAPSSELSQIASHNHPFHTLSPLKYMENIYQCNSFLWTNFDLNWVPPLIIFNF